TMAVMVSRDGHSSCVHREQQMSQDAQHAPLPTDATGQPAATRPEPGYHPFADEIAQMGEPPAQGASAPAAGTVPPESQQPIATHASMQSDPSTESPEPPVDWEARFRELQQQVEAQHQQSQAERTQFEQQQKQWLEYRQRENERQAAEARQAAE